MQKQGFFIPMPRCDHQEMALLPPRDKKLRCRHCHLTIDEKELTDGYCPECYTVYNVKRRDFEPVTTEDEGKIRYICEKCGAIITS
jgi:hypothetical protein